MVKFHVPEDKQRTVNFQNERNGLRKLTMRSVCLAAHLSERGWGGRCDWSCSSTRGCWGWAGGDSVGERLNAGENVLWVPSPARASLEAKRDWGVWSANTRYIVTRSSTCNVSTVITLFGLRHFSKPALTRLVYGHDDRSVLQLYRLPLVEPGGGTDGAQHHPQGGPHHRAVVEGQVVAEVPG